MTAPPDRPPLAKRLRALRRRGAIGAALAAAAGAAAGAWAQGSAAGALLGPLAGGALLGAVGVRATLLRRAGRAGFDPDAELSRGLSLILAGERFAAETCFREILARFPRDVEASFYLGLTLREHGDRAGAHRALARTLRIDVARKWTREIMAILTENAS